MLMPPTERATDVSTPASYGTAGDGVDTLDIMAKIQQVFSSLIPPLFNLQVREALAVLTRDDPGVSIWLSLNVHAM